MEEAKMPGEIRRIVNIADASPRSSRKSRTRLVVAAAVTLVLAVVLAIVLGSLGKSHTTMVNGYAISSVIKTDLDTSTDSSGTVVIPTQVTVTSPQEGYADKVLVKEGDKVGKDSVLAVLDVPDLIDEGDSLEAQLTVAQLALKDLEISYRYDLENTKQKIDRIDLDIADAKAKVESRKELAALKSARQSDYDDALKELRTLQQNREDYQSTLAQKTEARSVDLDKQKASIRQIELSLKRNRESIEEARVKSPIAGTVLSISDKLQVPGNLIQKYDEILVVADRNQTTLDFEVNEQYSSALKVGETIKVTSSSSSFNAVITSIGQVASLASDGLSATITVRAKPSGNVALTPGASVVATISLGTKTGTLVLPRGAYLTSGSQKYVYKVSGNTATRTEVSYGTIQGNQVEIKSGLEEGDRIITSSYQNFIDDKTIDLGTAQ